MHMSLWKFWALALFTSLWFVMTLDYFGELPAGGLLDLALTQAQVISALGALAAEGAHALEYHSWGTLTLDMVLPALLCAFMLTGLVRYVTKAFAIGLGALAVLYMWVDYWENLLSLQLLSGGRSFSANAWASALKFLFLLPPLAIVLTGLLRESYKAVLVHMGRRRRN